jgi:hypothetical protein
VRVAGNGCACGGAMLCMCVGSSRFQATTRLHIRTASKTGLSRWPIRTDPGPRPTVRGATASQAAAAPCSPSPSHRHLVSLLSVAVARTKELARWPSHHARTSMNPSTTGWPFHCWRTRVHSVISTQLPIPAGSRAPPLVGGCATGRRVHASRAQPSSSSHPAAH